MTNIFVTEFTEFAELSENVWEELNCASDGTYINLSKVQKSIITVCNLLS